MAYYHLTDDTKERLSSLLKERFPWLLVGLIGGIISTIIVSRFENILSKNISLAFFLPMIVYMADAIGTQTETIYIRNLAKIKHSLPSHGSTSKEGKDNFFKYLFKEVLIGFTFGIVFGLLMGLFSLFWFKSETIAASVAMAMFINATIAPVVALSVSEILFKEHTDPALGGGPFTTIVQDLMSLSIYLLIAALIVF